jgi:hypothetical protein
LIVSWRPLIVSVVRMFAGEVSAEFTFTEPRAEPPSLTRLTARLIESPGTKPVVETGMATAPPGWVRLIDSVPVSTVVFSGVVLSVKLP